MTQFELAYGDTYSDMNGYMTNIYSVFKGYFVPEVDGKYRLKMAHDDGGKFFMSAPISGDSNSETAAYTSDPENSR